MDIVDSFAPASQLCSNSTIGTAGVICSTIVVEDSTSSPSNMTTSSLQAENDILRHTECQSEFPACQAQRHLFLIVGPILLLMATVGNCLGLAVMRSKSLKNTATAVFITYLAISDTVAVWTGLTRHFIYKLTEYDIRQYSVWACRFQRFFLYISLDTSTWILTAVTVERFLAVCAPQRHAAIKTVARARLIVAMIVIFQTVFNMHVFFNYGKQVIVKDNKTETFLCGFSSQRSRNYITKYHGYISMAVYCAIPFIIMLTLNIFIIKKLQLMKKGFRNRGLSIKSQRRQAKSNSITKMLLTVTFYFILVSTPSFVYTLIQSKLLDTTNFTPRQYARTEVTDAISTLLLYLNHSMNFFLYCVSGKRFRKHLIQMISCGSDSHLVSTTSTATKSEMKKSVDDPSEQLSCNEKDVEDSI